jgi:hypothetical protein
MTEGAGSPRTEMERSIVQRSLEDDAFRQRLLADPKAAVEDELGTRLPEGVRVEAVEETADTIYLVLPSVSPAGDTGELSEQQLESVAGGWDPDTSGYYCPEDVLHRGPSDPTRAFSPTRSPGPPSSCPYSPRTS